MPTGEGSGIADKLWGAIFFNGIGDAIIYHSYPEGTGLFQDYCPNTNDLMKIKPVILLAWAWSPHLILSHCVSAHTHQMREYLTMNTGYPFSTDSGTWGMGLFFFFFPLICHPPLYASHGCNACIDCFMIV